MAMAFRLGRRDRGDAVELAEVWTVMNHDTKLTFEASTQTATIGNTPGASLPATGGPGTTRYYAAGAALLLLAVATLIFRKKADDE